MPLLQILEVLIVVGVLLWLVNRFIPHAGIHQVHSQLAETEFDATPCSTR
jgi:hypothetical protein